MSVPAPASRAGRCCTAGRRQGWRRQLRGITRNNVAALDVDIPLGVFTTVTGVSGSGKS